MRIKTIFIIVITILLTIVIMQNNNPVNLQVLFFSTRTSALMMMLVAAIAGFIIGYLAGRPKMKKIGNDYDHGYDEGDDNTHEGLNKDKRNTLSDEDREYIS
ncbi:LapA family protein [Mucilaginibacter mali]|uniref:LapA family protein n=1 Tax=Mucilaginibacter mali TaxID=2740462 RepID=A0A7D4QBJ0_9SPHI|nr:LapA family protein [Mucilaginibacter mali]QKJ30544.1 LapA family protein [Mucilaginibacter mali]